MDTAPIAVPVPVQPTEPQQPAPGKDAPVEGEVRGDGFATALEQQIAQVAAAGSNVAQLKLPVTNADDKQAPADTPEPPEPRDPATPDSLIAMMSAQLFAQTPHAAQPRAVAEPSGGITHAEGNPPIRQRPAERDTAAPAQNARPLQLAAATDVQHSTAATAHDIAPAPLPPHLMADTPSAAPPAPLLAPPAPAQAATPAPAHVEPRIDARVGTAEWGDGLARQVTLMVRDGEHTAQLRLDPPDLGPLEVRLSMAKSQDGIAHAQFVSPHAAVRDALEAALPQLRASLADNGITLGQASVGEGFARDDARQARQPSGGSGRGNDGMGAIAAPRTVIRHGLVDTFA